MSQIPVWVSKYIGIPFLRGGRNIETGLDCWGLFYIVYREQFGIELPVYGDVSQSTMANVKIGGFIVAQAHEECWEKIPPQYCREGDGLIMRKRGFPIHVAMHVARGWILHIERGIDSACERYDPLDCTIEGAYHHVAR